MHRVGRFLEAALLCLLKEEKAHGYALMEKLIEYDFTEDNINIGPIYRALRNMEADNLVISSWEDSEQGPKKRLYQITPKGIEVLDNWIDLLRYRKSRIEKIINNYECYNN